MIQLLPLPLSSRSTDYRIVVEWGVGRSREDVALGVVRGEGEEDETEGRRSEFVLKNIWDQCYKQILAECNYATLKYSTLIGCCKSCD